MTTITPNTIFDCAQGMSTLANIVKDLPKTQAVGIAVTLTVGALIAIDLATSRGFNVEFDISNGKASFTKACAT